LISHSQLMCDDTTFKTCDHYYNITHKKWIVKFVKQK
jgi:hypothetical protein